MDFETTKSGLAVPVTPPPPEKKMGRKFGLLELRDETNRVKATRALEDLWDAMELSQPMRILLPPHGQAKGVYDVHYAMWQTMACFLLGKEDCPEKEILT